MNDVYQDRGRSRRLGSFPGHGSFDPAPTTCVAIDRILLHFGNCIKIYLEAGSTPACLAGFDPFGQTNSAMASARCPYP